jgi:hypothetical protein
MADDWEQNHRQDAPHQTRATHQQACLHLPRKASRSKTHAVLTRRRHLYTAPTVLHRSIFGTKQSAKSSATKSRYAPASLSSCLSLRRSKTSAVQSSPEDEHLYNTWTVLHGRRSGTIPSVRCLTLESHQQDYFPLPQKYSCSQRHATRRL